MSDGIGGITEEREWARDSSPH